MTRQCVQWSHSVLIRLIECANKIWKIVDNGCITRNGQGDIDNGVGGSVETVIFTRFQNRMSMTTWTISSSRTVNQRDRIHASRRITEQPLGEKMHPKQKAMQSQRNGKKRSRSNRRDERTTTKTKQNADSNGGKAKEGKNKLWIETEKNHLLDDWDLWNFFFPFMAQSAFF